MPRNEPQSTSRKSLKRLLIAGVLLAVLAALAAYVVRAQLAWNTAHEDYSFPVSIEAPEMSEHATRVPVHVLGTDLDEQDVDKVFYIGGDTTSIELRRGAYTISIPASPLTSNGTFYTSRDEGRSYVVGYDEQNGHPVGSDVTYTTLSDGQRISFTLDLVPAEDITDEQIDAALQYALADEESAALAQDYAQTLREVRDAAVEQKRIEEEQQREAEEAEAKKVQVAEDFARAYFTTVEVTGPDDSYDNLKDIDRNAAALAYVEPDSQLAYELANPSYDPPNRGIIEVATYCKDVSNVSVSGNYVALEVLWAGTNSGEAGWIEQENNRSYLVVELNDQLQVSDFSIE